MPLLGKIRRPDRTKKQPREFEGIPSGWGLSSELVACVQPLSSESGRCFLQFAINTGARFNSHNGDFLDGIADTVDQTRVEAVLGTDQSPVCLWLRTPEPLDWRRTSATLKVHHVTPSLSCPQAYANRQPLCLNVSFIPVQMAARHFWL